MKVTIELEHGQISTFDSPTEAADYLIGLDIDKGTARRRRLNGLIRRLQELRGARVWWSDALAAYHRAVDAEYEDPARTVRCSGFTVFRSEKDALGMIEGLDRKIEMQRVRVQEMLPPRPEAECELEEVPV